MLLRDCLNEFELDWSFAPVRSEQISPSKLKAAKVLLLGNNKELQTAIAWSFLAWNDSAHLNLQVESARLEKDRFKIEQKYSEEDFAPEEADYVILTGGCCQEMVLSIAETMRYLKQYRKLIDAAMNLSFKKCLLLSDGRIYGVLGNGFAASEYEAGKTDPCAEGYEAQYLLQALEHIFVTKSRESGKAFQILRTGMLYGPCITMMHHNLSELAAKVAAGEPFALTLSQRKNSYLSIHDFLTALQFVLVNCPENKIFNVSGLNSDVSDGEIAMLLYQNFPDLCQMKMSSAPQKCGQEEIEENGGIWLNTQLIGHYGFSPMVSLEDGLIILVKSLQNTGDVFIFDNTYLGKLDKVQKILLGYLLEIDRICKKHDIKYFLAGGTLLGAIRHHGFIPWDDDADVMMLREDYDKFQQVVQEELPENIFMQIPETEKGNYNPFTKLRINNTMFATEFTGRFLDMHNGIFFDVLSHDKTGNHKWSQKLHLVGTMLFRSIVFNKWGDTDIKGGGGHPIVCKIVDRVKYLIPMRLALWLQNTSLTFFKNRNTRYLYDGMGRNLKRGSFPAEWLEEAVYVDFEGYQFPVPKEYDKYLTYLYGDYMQMIPVSQRRTSHSIVLMDLGKYGDYREPGKEKLM